MKNQSTIIAGSLLLAFVIFITVRGDLPEWLSLFTKQGKHEEVSVQTAAPVEKKKGGILGNIIGGVKAAVGVVTGNPVLVANGVSQAVK